ncbi:MAG: cytochrome c [Terriglobales bacterium]
MKRVLAAILVFCAGLLAQNIQYRPDPSWRPPDTAAARANPLARSPELAAGGRKLFQRHCAQCHGAQGQGLKNAADLQLPVVQQQGDGALFWKITNGNPRRAMPSFSGLPELQRWQIVLYLRTLPSAEKADAK